MLSLAFTGGTIELRGRSASRELLPASCEWDERTMCYRAPAFQYANIVRKLKAAQVEFEDSARQYLDLKQGARVHRSPRPFQEKALLAWRKNRSRGVVILPTGAGKTQVGVMAIDEKRRSTLVIAPTLVLVAQWYDLLRTTFSLPVGVIGGGEYRIESLTVTTYDSAYLHMEHIGNRFGLVIFDECHHLPGQTYAVAARFCLAPFRLGLTATPERTDGREQDLEVLIGPQVFRQDIVDLCGDYLAKYETERISVELFPDERAEYENEREIYLTFLRAQGIRMGDPTGWSQFVIRASRTPQGQRAMQAYRRQRELAFTAPAKLDYVEHLMHQHRRDRVIVFTQDNETAYMLSRRLLIPAITHQTKVSERGEILKRLHDGSYHGVVTSKVLNEGVDVPSANVAIVVSGSGSVREHVQRLGRVLRKQGDKRAVLYELITANTSEAFTSKRRRDHVAYR
ncbi:MAG: DEAD/DEAH box helicase family protein [Deltaproteobacteria bacterium]|nr:DEAD/DEAH box helicase family protein [Deltaproteobacteria bacterium]